MKLVCEATMTIQPKAFDQSHLNLFLSYTVDDDVSAALIINATVIYLTYL